MIRPCCGSSLQAHFESSGEFREPLWGVNCRGRLLMNRCFWEGPWQANLGNPGEVWGSLWGANCRGELLMNQPCCGSSLQAYFESSGAFQEHFGELIVEEDCL